MNKKRHHLSKQFFRGILVIALVACMLGTTVPKNFISAKAEDNFTQAATPAANAYLSMTPDTSAENLARSASITTNVSYEFPRPLTNINNGERYDNTWRGELTTNVNLTDYYQFNWDTPVSVNLLTLWTAEGMKQAPTGWTIYVSEDGEENWQKVDSVSDLRWNDM